MIEFKNVSKKLGDHQIFDALNLVIPDREIIGISGPSGVGKTTFLNLCAGLMVPDSGEVCGIKAGDVSCVFQEDRLLPWQTVMENITFVLKKENPREIQKVLSMVGLTGQEETYPKALSGGMRKRVAIARAFCYPSRLLLMDEPFGSLDVALKNQIMDDFIKLWQAHPRTVIFISHDIRELKRICDQILVFKGRPVQVQKSF